MQKPKYRVLCTTCDTYLPALRPLYWLMRRYWHPMPDVLVSGCTPPDFDLGENWTFLSVGKQEDFPFNKWSNQLITTLHAIPDEVILFMLDDMWPIRTVDTQALDYLYDYMVQFRYVAKMDLCADRLYAMGMTDYGYCNRLDIIKSWTGSAYSLSTMPGFWRKEHLLSVLLPDESPHQTELSGSPRLDARTDLIICGTRQWPLRVTLALRGGDASKLLTDGIQVDDIKALRALGYLRHWEG